MPQPRQQTSTPRRVGVREFRGNLTSLLKQVEDGQRFVLTSHHKVVAEIGPPSSDVVIRNQAHCAERSKLPMTSTACRRMF